MSAEHDRLLLEGPRSAPEPQTAGIAGASAASAAARPPKPVGRAGRSLILLAAVVVLVGMTAAHLLGPGLFIAVWAAVGVVQFLRRRRSR